MTIDLITVVIYALAMLAIGWFAMHRAKTREDYLVAGRNLGPSMYAATLSTVILGGASTLGTVRLGYVYGLSGLWFCTMMGLGIMVISLFLSKHLLNLKLFTVTELLERRYNPAARFSSSLIMVVYALMVAVVSIVATATILNGIFGIGFWMGVLLGGGIVVIYSTLGGMWSITLTDIVQFIIMTVGIMFLLMPLSINQAGGWDAMVSALPETHLSMINIGWPLLIGYFLNYFLGIMIGQDIWQRVFTARSVGVAKYAGAAAGLYCVLYGICGALIGMAGRVFIPELDNVNDAFAKIVQASLPDGIRGLVVAAALAALMSTASAAMMAAASTIAQDILPAVRKQPSSLNTNRIATLVAGLVTLALSLVLDDVFKPLTVAYNLLVGCMMVPLVGAIYWKRSSTTAALVSMGLSALVTLFFLW
ncbi:Sodium-coupled monocarboxylate transporter 2 [Pseudomonas reidholzensis]|uniref:Sodium-coupled monocarboxylate transporter 2 n=1 Tax=Pseudomonas reidholzensis TaxID=1785162 RepID=A0A383RVZ5_9PSED|nr:Sodium-coupled monocarboxylate transporter 2 [Pseudomonas reidholzensis]